MGWGAPAPSAARRDDLDLLAKLNEEHRRNFPRETELEARIRNPSLEDLERGTGATQSGQPWRRLLTRSSADKVHE